jgi:hypothetical protein
METKFKIIETPDYILAVSDEEIKKEDPYIKRNGIVCKRFNGDKIFLAKSDRKIIAHQPKGNAPELDGLPLLPEMVVEDDVEKLAKEANLKREFPSRGYGEDEFVEGYKAATKTYSEEDLRKAIREAIYLKNGFDKEGYSFYFDNPEIEEKVIKSLKQPKPKWFVAEREYEGETLASASGFSLKTEPILKTITINGKTYLVGKYLNE